MGYNLHITRGDVSSEKVSPEITVEEWLEYIRGDSELQLVEGSVSYKVKWTGPGSEPYMWLAWSHGNIYTKGPDKPLLEKMLVIAKHFGARVQGDDGEYYEDSSQL
jgi:hypothetical protein